MTTKTKKEAPTYVTTADAEQHPIALAFPTLLDVPLTFRRTILEVRDEFSTEKRGDTYATRRDRYVRVGYVLEVEGVRTGLEVSGDTGIDDVEFGPDGHPVDRAKWAAAVKLAVDDTLTDARRRLDELIELGLEAEKKGED